LLDREFLPFQAVQLNPLARPSGVGVGVTNAMQQQRQHRQIQVRYIQQQVWRLSSLSAILRLVALLPLVFVREQGSQGLMKFWQLLNISRQRKPLLPKAKAVTIPVTELANRSK
jgi:hypothetical protein